LLKIRNINWNIKSIIVLIKDEDYISEKILILHDKIELLKNDFKKISIKYDNNKNL